MNPMTRRWHLRTLLIWLLCTSSLVTFVVIGAVLFFRSLRKGHERWPFLLALALFVFLCYHLAGFWRRGLIGHPVRLLKGHVTILAPINLVEEIAKPISLSLRLFGNIFAGGIMVTLIALFPAWIMWAPNAIWKAFDLFVGLIQAFIFSLLTILYFGQAMDMGHDDDHAENHAKDHAESH